MSKHLSHCIDECVFSVDSDGSTLVDPNRALKANWVFALTQLPFTSLADRDACFENPFRRGDQEHCG